jgi:hypothetical protein
VSRPVAPYLAVAAVLAGLLVAPAAVAGPHQRSAATITGRVGQLAFVTPGNKIHVVTVKLTGKTLHERAIGPITRPTGKESVAIYAFMASGDRNWLAWQESVTRPNGTQAGKPVLVLREMRPSNVYQIKTADFPLGFAGDTLVTAGSHTSTVDLTPTPHLTKVAGNSFPEAVYPNGLVDVKPLTSPPGPKSTQRLQLEPFDGKNQVLHNYVLGPKNARIPETAYVSGDGRRLVVERGDHTDFGGIGPSSLVDAYSLKGTHTRSLLGHFGTAKAAWRVGDVSFAWPDDEVWAVWERATKHGAASAIAVHQHGTWRQILPQGIAVAGNDDGFVVAQAGKYTFANDGLQVTRRPIGDAILIHELVNKVMGIQGSAFAWVK